MSELTDKEIEEIASNFSLPYSTNSFARAVIEADRAQRVPEGWAMVPQSLIDTFPEINENNYDHYGACALNQWGCAVVKEAITAPQPVAQPELEAKLAQQDAEPVDQWQKRHPARTDGKWENTNEHDAKWWRDNSKGWEVRKLYTHPAPKAQPLTDDEIEDLWIAVSCPSQDTVDMPEFARATEKLCAAKWGVKLEGVEG